MGNRFERLKAAFPDAEERPDQQRYWNAIDKALVSGGRYRLMIEGGCGTGKSIGYLVPLIEHLVKTGGRAVISTAGKTLQNQLIHKDIPLARKIAGNVSFRLLQGKSNYICQERLKEYTDIKNRIHLEAINNYSRKPDVDGMLADVPGLPPEVTAAVCGSNDTCGSNDCRKKECFFFKAKQRALEASIVVVNHHLLVRHFDMQKKVPSGVLGEFNILIVDEAHELPDVARSQLGFRLTPGSFYSISRDIEKRLGMTASARTLMSIGLRLGKFLERMVNSGVFRIGKPLITDESKEILHDLEQAAAVITQTAPKTDQSSSLCDKLQELLGQLFAAITIKDAKDFVYWLQKDIHDVYAIECRFLSPRFFLDNSFGDKCVIMTSATLDAGDKFKFIIGDTGLTGAVTESVPSPFDFKSNCRLLIPNSIKVEPNDEFFVAQALKALNDIAISCSGRLLGLFTSRKMLDLAYESLLRLGQFPVIKQGQDTVDNLIRQVQDRPGTILLGTNSLWTGIDIRGDAVSCVVIDRIPFKSPEDPVHAALCERSSNPFRFVSLPKAMMSARQGAGRLIRSKTDRGVLCFLDRRVDTKTYGKTLRDSLPYMPRLYSTTEIKGFLDS